MLPITVYIPRRRPIWPTTWTGLRLPHTRTVEVMGAVELVVGDGREKAKAEERERGRQHSMEWRLVAWGKPRNGGSHKCGGPHIVRACTVPIQKA